MRREREEGSCRVSISRQGGTQSTAASLGDQWRKNRGVMGIKSGVRAEISADSPDSPSKSCKRSREGKMESHNMLLLVGRRRCRQTTTCSADSVKSRSPGFSGFGGGAKGESPDQEASLVKVV